MDIQHYSLIYSLTIKTLTLTHSAYGHAALGHSENVQSSMTLSIKPLGYTHSAIDSVHKGTRKMDKAYGHLA
jgi:hypothetical protein